MFERRRSLYDPVYGLSRTHRYPVGTTDIVTGTAFPVRTKPVSFAITINITDTIPAGVVFELGSATTGVAVWIASADRKLYAAFGDASAADGVTLTGPVCVDGQKLRIVVACIPESGKARMWVNGKLVAWGTASGGEFPNGWADTGAGAMGEVNTSITTRVAVGDRITLANADIVAPLSIYQNQRPKQFFEVA